jgi:alpha-glucosidase
MWTEAPKGTYGYYPSSIELRVFVPSIDGTHMSVLTEDDGLTFAATGSKESFLETQITVARAGRQLTLTGLVSGNSFPEFVRKDFRINLVGAGIREVIVLENTGEAFSLTIQL